MVQWVKAALLGLMIPETHMGEETNFCQLFNDVYMHAMKASVCVCEHKKNVIRKPEKLA